MSRCVFVKSWIGQCSNDAGEFDRCPEHNSLNCSSCGAPATCDCDHTGIQFVCGAPLCGQCWHAPPEDGNLGWFNLGGNHKSKVLAEQEWMDYYEKKYPMAKKID